MNDNTRIAYLPNLRLLSHWMYSCHVGAYIDNNFRSCLFTLYDEGSKVIRGGILHKLAIVLATILTASCANAQNPSPRELETQLNYAPPAGYTMINAKGEVIQAVPMASGEFKEVTLGFATTLLKNSLKEAMKAVCTMEGVGALPESVSVTVATVLSATWKVSPENCKRYK